MGRSLEKQVILDGFELEKDGLLEKFEDRHVC